MTLTDNPLLTLQYCSSRDIFSMRFILIALVSCLAVLAAPRPRSAAARPRTRLIAKRQTTRARIMGRESEKRIQAAAVRHNRTRALAPRASVAPYARYQGTETSPRTYAFFPGWDVAGNDVSALSLLLRSRARTDY